MRLKAAVFAADLDAHDEARRRSQQARALSALVTVPYAANRFFKSMYLNTYHHVGTTPMSLFGSDEAGSVLMSSCSSSSSYFLLL